METIWLSKVVMTEVQKRCTRLSVQIAKRNVKFPSSPEKTVRFIAETVFQSIKIAAANKALFLLGQWPSNKPFAPETV